MSSPLRVVFLNDSGLIYSDDYREGWIQGFKGIGCEVLSVDVSCLSRLPRSIGGRSSPYSTTHSGRLVKMIAQQVNALQPQLIFAHHGRSTARSDFLDYCRRSGAMTAVYLCDEPYECGETAKWSQYYDYVFTMDPCTLQLHRDVRSKRDERVWYLPPAANTDRFFPTDAARTIPALFLGNASLTPRPEYLRPVERMIPGAQIMYWEPTSKMHAKWVPLQKHGELYRSAAIGLNVHRNPSITEECFRKRLRDHSMLPKGLIACSRPPVEWGTGFWNDADLPAAHVNPRFFEMAACGVCVINDDERPELARMFPFAPRATTPDQFLSLVSHYHENKEEAQEVGRRCSKEIFKRHTYKHRAAEVLIRCGLTGFTVDSLSGSLGEPQEWLTLQDYSEHGISPLSAQTGAYAPFSLATGKSVTLPSGSPKWADLVRQVSS